MAATCAAAEHENENEIGNDDDDDDQRDYYDGYDDYCDEWSCGYRANLVACRQLQQARSDCATARPATESAKVGGKIPRASGTGAQLTS